MSQMMVFSWARIGVLALFLLFPGCVTLRETGETVFIMTSEKDEANLGFKAFDEFKKENKDKIVKDPAITSRVQKIADRIIPQVNVPHAQWEVVVIDDKTPNAFALPGGKIGVHTGMLSTVQNDHQLAAVIGHEIAHVTLRHSGQRFSAQFPIMLGYASLGLALQHEDYKTKQLAMTAFGIGSAVFGTLPYSRHHENQADRLGLMYAAKAGFDPREAPKFWKVMEQHADGPPEFLSTHPSDGNRIKALETAMPEALRYYQMAGGKISQ